MKGQLKPPAELVVLTKYPTSSLQYEREKNKDIRKHKLGYYYAEQESFYRIAKETGTLLSENDVARHPLAYLMEAADDIAYSTADLEDAYKKGLFTLQEFIEFFEKEMKEEDPEKRDKVERLLRDLKERLPEEESGSAACMEEAYMIAFQNWMDFVRQWFMYCVAYSFSKNYREIMSGTYNQELIGETFHGPSMKILKSAMAKFVYGDAEIVKLELSARKILSALLNDFVYAVICYDEPEKQTQAEKKLCSLIPGNLQEDYRHAKKDPCSSENQKYNLYLRFLMVTDFISGMTDTYAKNLYQELNGI